MKSWKVKCWNVIPIGFFNVTFLTPLAPLIKGGAIKEEIPNSNPIGIKNLQPLAFNL